MSRHADDDDVALRPNPSALLRPGAEGAGDGTYKAPRHSSTAYKGRGNKDEDDDEDDSDDSDDEGLLGGGRGGKDATRKPRVARSTRGRREEIMRLVRDSGDQPEHRSSEGGALDSLGTGNKAARRERLKTEAVEREKFEEDRFRRVDNSKKAKKKRKVEHFQNSLEELI